MYKTNTRNCSIDIFRYICAIMVVAIHTHPFTEVSANVEFVFSQVFSRIGVPFFFAVAGYFYTQKLDKNQKPFFPYIKRILITYFIWSCIYYFIDFIQGGYKNIIAFFENSAYMFFVTGSHYHFWFFPALIFAVCFTTFLYKIKCQRLLIPLSIVLYCIGVLGCSYFKIGIRIPVLGVLFTSENFELIRRIFLMGFPLFISGYIVYKVQEKVERKVSDKNLFFLFSATVLIWLLEIFVVVLAQIADNLLHLVCICWWLQSCWFYFGILCRNINHYHGNAMFLQALLITHIRLVIYFCAVFFQMFFKFKLHKHNYSSWHCV